MVIDCSACTGRELTPPACSDCVVSVLLGPPPSEVEAPEVAALAVLAGSGLVPPLRMTPGNNRKTG